ncbi:MAG: hypothetical protein QNJ16_06190 [Rhodobacter sp.]|nr:hypothetical protein [Rhodobacter sp.]
MFRITGLALAFSVLSVTAATTYEITPALPETGFPHEFDADILGLSVGMTADDALAALKDRFPAMHFNNIRTYAFPQTDVTFTGSFSNHPLPVANGSSESFRVRASSPASGNQVYVVHRHVIFPREEPPTIASIMSSLVGKYGPPSSVDGNGSWIWAFRDGERLGMHEDAAAHVVADPGQIQERIKDLPQDVQLGLNPLISCATHAAIWNVPTDNRLGNTRNQPCDAYLYVKILEDRTHKGRAVNMTIAVADLKRRLSSAVIDNNALAEAEAERQGRVAASGAPEL